MTKPGRLCLLEFYAAPTQNFQLDAATTGPSNISLLILLKCACFGLRCPWPHGPPSRSQISFSFTSPPSHVLQLSPSYRKSTCPAYYSVHTIYVLVYHPQPRCCPCFFPHSSTARSPTPQSACTLLCYSHFQLSESAQLPSRPEHCSS